jgi:uncharacterized membrane protein YjjP (DUF1212 family)
MGISGFVILCVLWTAIASLLLAGLFNGEWRYNKEACVIAFIFLITLAYATVCMGIVVF